MTPEQLTASLIELFHEYENMMAEDELIIEMAQMYEDGYGEGQVK